MKRLLLFTLAVLLLFSSCVPAVQIQDITLTPSATATATSSPTPTESPTPPPAQFRENNGGVEEWNEKEGEYQEIKTPADNVTVKLGENGYPQELLKVTVDSNILIPPEGIVLIEKVNRYRTI